MDGSASEDNKWNHVLNWMSSGKFGEIGNSYIQFGQVIIEIMRCKTRTVSIRRILKLLLDVGVSTTGKATQTVTPNQKYFRIVRYTAMSLKSRMKL